MKNMFCGIVLFVLLSGCMVERIHSGFYFSPLDVLYCTDESSCLHEIGHRVDHYGGWVSGTPEYRRAVADFAANSTHPWATIARDYQGNYREMYADMLESSLGVPENMPAELRGFYDWGLVQQQVEELNANGNVTR